MLRACSLKTFMLLFATFLLSASAATIAKHGDVDEGRHIGETKPTPSLARQRKPTKLTTKMPLPNQTTLIAQITTSSDSSSGTSTGEQREYFYHPAVVTKPRLIERYDKRALDGHYEYRYVLSNGDVRYERAYWQPVGHKKVLARKGYYSYPLPNQRFHTVFYTADHMGFREDESSISRTRPLLPRNIEVPHAEASEKVTSTIVEQKNEQKVQAAAVEEKEVQTNKINRKPNWTPTTKSILQKGRIVAIAVGGGGGGAGQDATKTRTAIRTTIAKRETNNERRRTSAIEAASEAVGATATASSATNRPQINKEKVSEPKANAISVSSGMKTTTTTTLRAPTPLPITEATVQASQMQSETINPIKDENSQTHAVSEVAEEETATATTTIATEAETEQLATVDTTATVLSVD